MQNLKVICSLQNVLDSIEIKFNNLNHLVFTIVMLTVKFD